MPGSKAAPLSPISSSFSLRSLKRPAFSDRRGYFSYPTMGGAVIRAVWLPRDTSCCNSGCAIFVNGSTAEAMGMRVSGDWVAAIFVTGILAASIASLCAQQPTFDTAVTPVLKNVCANCHNAKSASGGFDVTPFLKPESLTTQREGWDDILGKLRSGEMPPEGAPKPQAQIDALIQFVQGELDKGDGARFHGRGNLSPNRQGRDSHRQLLAAVFRRRPPCHWQTASRERT